MLHPSPASALSLSERLRSGAGRRALALGLVLFIEALLLLAFLSISLEKQPGKEDDGLNIVDLRAPAVSDPAPEPSSPEPARAADERRVPERPAPEQPQPPTPAEPLPPRLPEAPAAPVAPRILPIPSAPLPSAPPAAAPRAPAAKAVFGPPDRGGSPAMRDTERVGTAPNGEPLYAAAWYREPEAGMLRDYLSTATGPGWGLIACRTAPDYRVEDCVGLDEYPQGSQIGRAVLAAAWEFRVRPPRLGGRPLVGGWVRIRIDYERKRR